MNHVAHTLWEAFVGLALIVPAGFVRADAFDLQRAVDEAAPGETILVPSGTYNGPIAVAQSITLEAQGPVVLDSGGDGDVLTITAPRVTVRGFTIRNTGDSLDRENAGITVLAERVTIEDNTFADVLFGIYLKNAPHSVIRGNTIGGKDLYIARRGDGIRLWYSPHCTVEDNVVTDSRDVVMWFSDDVVLRRNVVRNGRYGLHFMYSDANVLEDNHLDGNSVGAFLMYSNDLVLRRNIFTRNRGPSGYGVGLKDMDGVDARDNLFVGNRIGVYLDNSPSTQRGSDVFQRNHFISNDIGVAFLPSVKRNTFTENTFSENIQQVAVLGSGNFGGNHFDVDGRGNFWSDYNGYDLDEDGIGDLPYTSQSFFEDLMDREPKLRLFLYSPAQQALDLAARAFPAVRPRPKFSDEFPLSRPVALDVTIEPRRSAGSLLAVAAALLGLSALVLVGAGWRTDIPHAPSHARGQS